MLLGAPTLMAQSGDTIPQEPVPVTEPEEDPKNRAPDAGTGTPRRSEKVVVSGSRSAQDPFEIPFTSSVIDSADLRERQYRSTPQALRDVPGVLLQETAYGHGSPYIRGFTSFRTLFLIDGIRLNNSVFRPGPNQYWNTVDPFSLDRIEVLKGPNSVLYGSDAVGGTVQAFSRAPTRRSGDDGEVMFGGRTMVRYGSADDSIIGRGEVEMGYEHEGGAWSGLMFGGTGKHFDDLEAGASTGNQLYTGYDELDFDAKFVHDFGNGLGLTIAHQSVQQRDVPRTHRTIFANGWRGTDLGSDLEREFDQDRTLTYIQFYGDDLGGAIDAFKISASLHNQEERRDRTRSNGNQEATGFDVDTWGLWAQAESETGIGRLTYGAEWYHDEVDSFFERVGTPAQPGDDLSGPIADDSTYDLFAVFVQDTFEVDDQLSFTLGGRFNYAAAKSDKVRDPDTGNAISVDDSWDDFVFSARGRYEVVPDEVAIYGGVSQGFRAPNLSDLSRFDDARTNEFEVPSTGLDAERYIQYEIGMKIEEPTWAAETAFFYTDIQDQILRFPTGNMIGTNDEVRKANVGDGYVYGIEFGGSFRIVDEVTLFGNAAFLEGQVENYVSPGVEQQTWLTRMMPLTYQVGVRWDDIVHDRFWAETRLVRAEKADKLSFGDMGDTSRIPMGGTPAYTVWDIGAGARLSDDSDLVVRVENLTDDDYRIHGSGLNRPGRNFLFALETRF